MAKKNPGVEITIQLDRSDEKKHSIVYREKDGPHSFYISKEVLGDNPPAQITASLSWN